MKTRLQKIEDVARPQIGKYYLVRCVQLNYDTMYSNHYGCHDEWVPVYGNPHVDQHCLQFKDEHLHYDWRFVSKAMYQAQTLYMDSDSGKENGKVMTRDSVLWPPQYRQKQYKRHHSPYPTVTWHYCLEDEYVQKRLKNMICPHQGANLTSCPVTDGVVTCPLHGLQWVVSTGELVRRTEPIPGDYD